MNEPKPNLIDELDLLRRLAGCLKQLHLSKPGAHASAARNLVFTRLAEYEARFGSPRKYNTANDVPVRRGDYSWYPVRCCCEPQKILGFIRLRDGYVGTSRIALRDDDGVEVAVTMQEYGGAVYVTDEFVRDAMVDPTVAGALDNYARREMAVRSDNHPVEWWNKLSEFVETERVTAHE